MISFLTSLISVFKDKTKFDYKRLIREFHDNQEKAIREIIKMNRKSSFADRWFKPWRKTLDKGGETGAVLINL